MRLCRFDADRLGVLRGDMVVDVTSVLDSIPAALAARSRGSADRQFRPAARPDRSAAALGGVPAPSGGLRAEGPVANPRKILGALKEVRN